MAFFVIKAQKFRAEFFGEKSRFLRIPCTEGYVICECVRVVCYVVVTQKVSGPLHQ
jgi:hypothetical protein